MSFKTLIAAIAACFVILVPLQAEFVFLKDGSIIDGKIISDEADSITIRQKDQKINTIARTDLIRIIYTDLYMGKVFVRLTTGEVVEGYQIDEDRDNYTFRKEINKPEEFTLSRKKVMFIARTNPTDLSSEASIERIVITWSPPFKPAKSYKVYMREIKSGEPFKVAGETADVEYVLKNLSKSTSYEVYVTAIAETGEESLPSEKIITNTIPVSPDELRITEKNSDDGKLVTLTMTWDSVTDTGSRVASYSIYNIDDDRKKIGNTTGNEFVMKDFPAEGRHWFALVSVNDLGVESTDVKAVYDAGFKIYTRIMGSYIYPLGTMKELSESGYGGLFDFGLSRKKYSLGIETGYFRFNCKDDIKSMVMIPALLEMNYMIPLFYTFSFRPVIKTGGSFDMIEYIVHDKADPLITRITSKKNFDPMCSAGAYLQFDITDHITISAGVEYAVIFQKSGRMSFASGSSGIGIIF